MSGVLPFFISMTALILIVNLAVVCIVPVHTTPLPDKRVAVSVAEGSRPFALPGSATSTLGDGTSGILTLLTVTVSVSGISRRHF